GGSAGYLPELLQELETTRNPKIIDILWERLYHLGSVFSASFAALPYLARIAEQWQPNKERLKLVSLAVEILSGEDIENLRRPGQPQDSWTTTSDRIDLDSPYRGRYQEEIDILLRLVEEHMQQPNLSSGEFSYLLVNILPLKGYASLKNEFEYLVSTCWCGWSGCCSFCNTEMEIYPGEDNIIAELETDNGKKQQTDIQPISPESLTGIMKWLYDTATEKGYESIARKITCMMGTGTCLNCGEQFNMPEYFGFAESLRK
ncbi:MAG: hypothetical protein ACFCAD_24200, partial [Pleurocapsa sp.]